MTLQGKTAVVTWGKYRALAARSREHWWRAGHEWDSSRERETD